MATSKSRGEPDGPMNEDMAAFNIAVMSLDKGNWVPFICVYCDFRPEKEGKPLPIKTIAYDLGIQPPAFYDRANKSAIRVHNLMRKIAEVKGM